MLGGGPYLSSYSHSEGFSPSESSLCINPKAGLPRRFAPRNDVSIMQMTENIVEPVKRH